MAENTTTPSISENLRVKASQLELLFKLVPAALAGSMAVGLMVLVLLWGQTEQAWLLGWYGLLVAITVVRLVLRLGFDRDAHPEHRLLFWRLTFALPTLASGLVWGAAVLVLFPELSQVHRAVLLFLVAGVAAGTVGSYGVALEAFLAFTLPALGLVAWRLFSIDSQPWNLGGLGVVAYMGVLLATTLRINRFSKMAIDLRFRNMDLICDLKAAQERIQSLANHDNLTGLANRRLLEELFEMSSARADRNLNMLAVLYLDLDRFKPVNDNHGHAMGDEVLRLVARRLETVMRNCDCVARVGGDEFVILVSDVTGAEDVGVVARKVLDAVARPLTVDGIEIRLGATLGGSLFPDHGRRLEDLVNLADAAMYRARAAGNAGWMLHDPDAKPDTAPKASI